MIYIIHLIFFFCINSEKIQNSASPFFFFACVPSCQTRFGFCPAFQMDDVLMESTEHFEIRCWAWSTAAVCRSTVSPSLHWRKFLQWRLGKAVTFLFYFLLLFWWWSAQSLALAFSQTAPQNSEYPIIAEQYEQWTAGLPSFGFLFIGKLKEKLCIQLV